MTGRIARTAALGLMRLSTEPDRDEGRALGTIEAALAAGVRLFDTAPSYALGDHDLHHNERLLGRAIRASRVPREEITVVTKAGLTREGTRWVPDGRASAIRESAAASTDALGVGIDVLLLHCADPRVKLETSVRALEAAAEDGLAKAIGLSNLGRRGLTSSTAIAVIEERIGAFDDRALRSGLVGAARERGALVLAHTPLGAPSKVARIAKSPVLAALAKEHDVTPATLVLAWLHHHDVIPLAGATRPETAALAARAASISLTDEQLDRIATAIGARPREVRVAPLREGAEIVLVMGIQGAGKTRHVEQIAKDGHVRLNRDERGGTMKKLHAGLERSIAEGGARFVLDNTYPTRASREEVIDIGRRHGLAVRCVWLDTPLHEAQVNACARLIERHGALLAGEELARAQKHDPGAFLPSVQHRYLRELEPPEEDEGFAAIDRVAFERATSGIAGRVVAIEAAVDLVVDRPTLVIGWSPTDAPLDRAFVERARMQGADIGLCEHAAGPPTCWCRPPLPGLVVAWLRERGIDARASTFVGTTRTHAAMAEALGMRFEPR